MRSLWLGSGTGNWGRLVALACAVLSSTSACSSNDAPGGPNVGIVDDERTLTVDETMDVTVRLGRTVVPIEVDLPARALPPSTTVAVRVVSGLTRNGPTVSGPAVQIDPPNLTFSVPMRARQTLPAAPLGRRYLAVQAPPGGTDWLPRRVGRRVIAQPNAEEIWEIDLEGSGFWAFALEEPPVADAGAPDGGGASIDGTELDVGGRRQTVLLGAGPQRTVLEVPADALPERTRVTAALTSVAEALNRPTSGVALRIGPAALAFARPLVMQ